MKLERLLDSSSHTQQTERDKETETDQWKASLSYGAVPSSLPCAANLFSSPRVGFPCVGSNMNNESLSSLRRHASTFKGSTQGQTSTMRHIPPTHPPLTEGDIQGIFITASSSSLHHGEEKVKFGVHATAVRGVGAHIRLAGQFFFGV